MSTETKGRCYISGPMRGRPAFNFPAFDAARDYFLEKGWQVVSPADHDRETYPGAIEDDPGYATGDLSLYQHKLSMKELALWDVEQLADCTAIVMLPEWEQSKGARAERAVAEWLGLDVFYYYPILVASGQAFVSELY